VFNCGKCDCDPITHKSPIKGKWDIVDSQKRVLIRSDICLRWLVTQRSIELITLYDRQKNNVLPWSGGWLDQPNVFVQAVAIISRFEKG